MDLATLVTRMQADNSQYVKALDQATAKLAKFQRDQESMLGGLAEKFVALFTIDKLVEFTASAIENAASLEKISQQAGATVEEISSLSLAFAAAGLSNDDLGISLKKLNVAISDAAGNATSKAGAAFRAFGVDIHNADGSIKGIAELLPDLADAYARTADGPNKVAAGQAILGRSADKLIPVLDGGREALAEYQKQAAEAGLVLSGPAAKAAEDFSRQLNVLKAEVTQGAGNALATTLLPVLATLATAFADAIKGSTVFGEALGLAVEGIKLAAEGIVIVVGELFAVGKAAVAVGKAFYDLNTFNFSGAATAIKEGFADAVKTAKGAIDTAGKIADSGANAQIAALNKVEEAKNNKPPVKNLTEIEEQDKAIAKLKDFAAGLVEQAQSFGLGEAALVKYKLQFGPLHDALEKGGDDARKYADQALAAANALQGKKDNKTVTDYTNALQQQILKYGEGSVAAIDYATHTGDLGKALDRLKDGGVAARNTIHALAVEQVQLKNTDAYFSIDQQLLQLSGHLGEAAAKAFDFHNKLLIKDTAANGTDEQKAQLDQLQKLEVAQAQFNELAQQRNVIEQTYSETVAAITAQQNNGALNDIDAINAKNAALNTEISQLSGVYDQQKRIADQNGKAIPKLTQDVKAFGSELNTLKSETDVLTKQIRDGFESAFANNFSDLITGAKSFGEAFKGLMKDIQKQLADLVSKNIAQSIFGQGGAGGGIAGTVAGLFSGGGGGGLASLAGLFGGGGGASIASTGAGAAGLTGGDYSALIDSIGGFASGGTMGAGSVRVVGENGPELAFSGPRPMSIVPGGKGHTTNVTNHFIVQSTNGTISRQSQTQLASLAARSLGAASQRNNR